MFSRIIQNIKPEKVFLLYSLLFGLLFIILTPPFQIPDENYHFYHAYTISEFYSHSSNGYESVPTCFDRFDTLFTGIAFHNEVRIKPGIITSLTDQELNPDSRRESFSNPAAPYTFAVYIPQIIGIWTGRLFSLSPVFIFYLGRLFALLFWTAVISLTFRIIPFRKWTYLLIALTPISVFLAGSYSADCVLNSYSLLFTSLVFCYAYDEKINFVDWKKTLLLILISSAFVTSKPPYIILLFIYFLIPAYKFKDKKRYYFTFIVIVFANLLFLYLWNNLAKTPINTNTPDIKEQILSILQNPFDLIKVLINTFLGRYKALSQQFVGKLGWLDTEIPGAVVVLYLFTFILVAVLDNSGIKVDIKLKQKLFSASVLISLIVIIFILFYFITPKDNLIIWGVQGRYFIPAHLILIILFYNNKFKVNGNLIKLFAVIISFLTLSVTAFVLVARYFIL